MSRAAPTSVSSYLTRSSRSVQRFRYAVGDQNRVEQLRTSLDIFEDTDHHKGLITNEDRRLLIDSVDAKISGRTGAKDRHLKIILRCIEKSSVSNEACTAPNAPGDSA